MHLADAKPGPSHTASHTSHIPSPALSSSDSHTVQAVAVSMAGLTVGGLIFCFSISALNSIFYMLCAKNTSYGIEGKFYLVVRESPFPYPLNVKAVLASLFIMFLFLKMRNSPLRLQSTHLEHWSGGLRKQPVLSLVGEVGSSSGRLSSPVLCTRPECSPEAITRQDCSFRFVRGT